MDWVYNTSLIIQGFFFLLFRLLLRTTKNISNVISILFKYLEQKFSLQVQQNYGRNLFNFNNEEPERRRQSCSCFFFLNIGHASSCCTSTVSASRNDHQVNTVVKDIDSEIQERKFSQTNVSGKVCGKGLLFKLTVKLLFLEIQYCGFHYCKVFISLSKHLCLYSRLV